jgi:hypothetical protein
MKAICVMTPQFRTMLIRKLKNIFPSCSVEIVDGIKPGIGFRLRDRHGKYRSNIARIYRYNENVLSRDKLISVIKREGSPAAGFPDGL